ncbi:MAG TPA: zf-HC2 domain-containing protein [Thermomicrobiales bacterium]
MASGANPAPIPTPITPEDLIAFADGEASEQIAEQIGADSTLRAAAEAYARTQRQLQDRLYRFDCPPSLVLGEYDLGLLDPLERRRIAAHVVECPHCTAELRMLRDFLAMADDVPPVGAMERLRRRIATVLPPPPRTSPYASLRGADDATARTYQAGDVTITLDLGAPVRRGRTSLVGLLWRNGDDPERIADSVVALMDEAGTTQTTAIDEVGNFTFDEIIPGTYQLEVTLGDDTIIIEGLLVGQ